MDFDELIERRGTHSTKWDMMESLCGVSAQTGLPMWVADMDFRPPACVQGALEGMLAHGVYGYFGDDTAYRDAICGWMDSRHGWTVKPEMILTAHGLVNGTAMCIETFSAPGEGVVLMTPVYHAFAKVIMAAGRRVVECPLVNATGRYEMDFKTWDALMTGAERILILCSPHNPGGRVWTPAELNGVADFCQRHNLILVSDEIHHDLIYPGHRHTVMPNAAPGITDRLVMLTATTKTFNIAGAHIGNLIVPDPELCARISGTIAAWGISPNSFGMHMATAAYSAEGAVWVDALMQYLDGNRRVFDAGIEAIPGLSSMRLEGTYLAWVDGSGTGMSADELTSRVQKVAGIAANLGPTFGTGGEMFLRFNMATQRVRVMEAVDRLQAAFADLQ